MKVIASNEFEHNVYVVDLETSRHGRQKQPTLSSVGVGNLGLRSSYVAYACATS